MSNIQEYILECMSWLIGDIINTAKTDGVCVIGYYDQMRQQFNFCAKFPHFPHHMSNYSVDKLSLSLNLAMHVHGHMLIPIS